jgi:hypothetical protein
MCVQRKSYDLGNVAPALCCFTQMWTAVLATHARMWPTPMAHALTSRHPTLASRVLVMRAGRGMAPHAKVHTRYPPNAFRHV